MIDSMLTYVCGKQFWCFQEPWQSQIFLRMLELSLSLSLSLSLENILSLLVCSSLNSFLCFMFLLKLKIETFYLVTFEFTSIQYQQFFSKRKGQKWIVISTSFKKQCVKSQNWNKDNDLKLSTTRPACAR